MIANNLSPVAEPVCVKKTSDTLSRKGHFGKESRHLTAAHDALTAIAAGTRVFHDGPLV
jgi:hypothetical protein